MAFIEFHFLCRTLSPAAGAAGKLLVGNCWADAGQQRRLVSFFIFFAPIGFKSLTREIGILRRDQF